VICKQTESEGNDYSAKYTSTDSNIQVQRFSVSDIMLTEHSRITSQNTVLILILSLWEEIKSF